MARKRKVYSQIALTVEELKKDPEALFVCSHSGGKDSQAMYLYLKGIIPKERLIVIHADLGKVEWVGTLDHVEKYLEHELRVIKSPDLLEMVAKRGKWPDGIVRYCTNNLKTNPITDLSWKIAQERGFKYVVNCMGIRAEESPSRALKAPFEYSTKKSAPTKARFIFDWNPIFTWSTRDVFKYIEINNELPHYAYLKGMTRLSCRFCVLANKADIRLSAELNPELLEEYVALEKKIGHTIKMHRSKPILLSDWMKLPDARKGKELVRYSDICG